ncbi:MAG: hypothetical protein HOY79_51310 [Streptomyces sp.]|nr:hypothetical protein [Streptomyces sp.]
MHPCGGGRRGDTGRRPRQPWSERPDSHPRSVVRPLPNRLDRRAERPGTPLGPAEQADDGVERRSRCPLPGERVPHARRWAQGFKPHYDTHDVFVLQVHGTKRWPSTARRTCCRSRTSRTTTPPPKSRMWSGRST